MKLTTKLKIFGVFMTYVVILIGGIIYWRFSQEEMAIKKNDIAANIVGQAFTLLVLNDEYIQTHGKRAEIQWISQHRRLDSIIASYTYETPQEQSVIAQLQHQESAIFSHFSSLESLIHTQGSEVQENSLLQQSITRLQGQLTIDMQTIVALADSLSLSNTARLTALREVTTLSILILIVLLGLSFILSYTLLARSISLAVQRLIQGTRKLAEGNFDVRLTESNSDEFGELSHSFNSMATQLGQLESAKDEFITLASHELRTPITAIKGFLYMLLKGGYGPLPDAVRTTLERISASTDRQVRLVNDLLDVSRIQTGTITFTQEDFVLGPVVQEVAESLQHIAKQKGVSLTVISDREIYVHADEDWVRQILTNLMENALKFTGRGSIQVSYALGTDTLCYISVSDTGIGISQENQKKLFRKFQQLSSKALGKPDGSGLGLYISRYIAREMGGDVWIEKSLPKKGSVFIFSLRIAQKTSSNG